MNFDIIKHRLLQLEVAHICDTSAQAKLIHRAIRPLTPGLKMVGVARTVNCDDDLLGVLKSIQEIQAHEVLVIAANGKPRALFGEIISSIAKYKNAAGILCDGACRDILAIQQMRFPVYAHSFTPEVASKTKTGETQVPVVCGGVIIQPGDIVFGDDDGVIAIALEELTLTLPRAEALQAREQDALARIRSGENFFKDILSNFDEYYASVTLNQPTTLKWEGR